LFKDFLYNFKAYLQIPVDIGKKELLTMQDSKYSGFIIGLLQCLEPRKFEKHEILFKELQEVEEMLFIQTGQVICIGLTDSMALVSS